MSKSNKGLSKYNPDSREYEGVPSCVQVKLEMNDVSNLVGKILTVADASFTDKQQREGVKSLIKQIVWAWGKDWHIAATEAQIKEMENNSETVEGIATEDQIENYIE